jgi:hypothetical protein
VNSQPNMLTETLQMSRLTNGEAENSLQKQSDQIPHQGLNGRCGKGSDGTSSRPFYDENGGEVSKFSRIWVKLVSFDGNPLL